MHKGSFITETFNPSKPTIVMRNWVEPTLYNTGETTVFLNGIAIAPKDSFILGAIGVEMNGTYNILFPESTKKNEVKVNYVLLTKACLSTNTP